MQNHIKSLTKKLNVRKIFKLLCIIIICFYLIANGIIAARPSSNASLLSFEDYSEETTITIKSENFVESFFMGITLGLLSTRPSSFSAEEGDVIYINVASSRTSLKNNTAKISITSPSGQKQSVVFNKSSSNEIIDVKETGTWSIVIGGYFDKVTIINYRPI